MFPGRGSEVWLPTMHCRRLFGQQDISLPYLALSATKSAVQEHPFGLTLDLRWVFAIDFEEVFGVLLAGVNKLRFYPLVAVP